MDRTFQRTPFLIRRSFGCDRSMGVSIVTLSIVRSVAVAAASLLPAVAMAGGIDGAQLSVAWAVPFAGILLSIALFPLFAPHIWHHHFGKIAVFWALCCAVPMGVVYGLNTAFNEVVHILLVDYVPFIIFVGSLFIVAGGIHIRGSFVGRPIVNTAMLALGAVLANFMGTTGAAMLLIRPLIGANENRTRKVHTFIFFIFLVANVGGSLTPLGDPPLFLGFLKGVSFFWTAEHLLLPWLVTCSILLAIYFLLDSFMFARDVKDGFKAPEEKKAFGIDGGINILLLAGIVASVLISGFWRSGVELQFLGVHFFLKACCVTVSSSCSLLLRSYLRRAKPVKPITSAGIRSLKWVSSSSVSSFASCQCSLCFALVWMVRLPRWLLWSPMLMVPSTTRSSSG